MVRIPQLGQRFSVLIGQERLLGLGFVEARVMRGREEGRKRRRGAEKKSYELLREEEEEEQGLKKVD